MRLEIQYYYVTFKDYSWDDQGFSVLSTFYHDLAVILDDKFRTAKCIVKQSEKSSKLNRAVWSYVQVELLLCTYHHPQSISIFLSSVCWEFTMTTTTTRRSRSCWTPPARITSRCAAVRPSSAPRCPRPCSVSSPTPTWSSSASSWWRPGTSQKFSLSSSLWWSTCLNKKKDCQKE